MRAVRCVVVLAALAIALDAEAQSSGLGRRLEVTGAAGLATGSALGVQNANLQTNSTTPQPLTLFSTRSGMDASWLADARVGFLLTRRVSVEGRLGYSRPTLRTSVSADTEGAASVAVVERVDQYVIDAGVVVRLDEVRIGRLVPHVAVGAGYLRQLHEGLVAIEQGHMYHLGGGVTRDLVTRTRGLIRTAGLRADARVDFLSGGIALNDRLITQGAFTAGVFLRF